MPRSRYDQQTGDSFHIRTEAEREYLYYYFWPWVCNIGDELSLTPPPIYSIREIRLGNTRGIVYIQKEQWKPSLLLLGLE